MEIQGSITILKARINASGDLVQILTLECHGEFAELFKLLKKPLKIHLEENA
jgi:hypothetical protein